VIYLTASLNLDTSKDASPNPKSHRSQEGCNSCNLCKVVLYIFHKEATVLPVTRVLMEFEFLATS